MSKINKTIFLILLLAAATIAQTTKPAPAPVEWRPFLGEYASPNETLIVLEKDGKLVAVKRGDPASIKEVSPNFFLRDKNKKVSHLKIDAFIYERRPLGPEEGATQLKVKPLRPVKELIKEALNAQPPQETGDFLPSDLVELRKLDDTIKLDIRYATTNNLFGTEFYSQPVAPSHRGV